MYCWRCCSWVRACCCCLQHDADYITEPTCLAPASLSCTVIAPVFNHQIEMKHAELVLRQQRLLLRSTELRLSLADQLLVLKRPLALLDRTRDALQWLYRPPLWPTTGLLVLLVLQPKRIILWGGRLWWSWKAFQRAQDWMISLPYFFAHNGSHGHDSTPHRTPPG